MSSSTTTTSTLSFGSFQFCNKAPFPLCDLVAIPKTCSVIPFAAGGGILNLAELLMCSVGIVLTGYFWRFCWRKKAGVGRQEMLVLLTWLSLALMADWLQSLRLWPATVQLIFGVVQVGATMATVISLLLNGLIVYQWIEDGTIFSVSSVFGLSALYGAGVAYLLIDVNLRLHFSITPNAPINYALFVTYLVIPLVCIVGYALAVSTLVYTHLKSKKPITLVWLAVVSFALSQMFGLYVSPLVCEKTNGKLDGRFLVTFWILVGVWWVIHFWDSITEDAFEDDDEDAFYSSSTAMNQQQQQQRSNLLQV